MSRISTTELAAGAFIGRMVQKYGHRLNNKQRVRDMLSRKEFAEMHKLAREVEASQRKESYVKNNW